jgi:hypothetical protein
MSTAWTFRTTFLLLSILSLSVANAQVTQVGRFEIRMEDDKEEKYTAARLGENGLLIYRRLTGKKEDQFELIKIDTTLKQEWKGFVPVDKKLDVLQVKSQGDIFYMLLKDPGYVGKDFVIISINQKTGAYRGYSVRNIIPFYPTEFVLTTEAALIGGYFNSRPLVLYFNFSQQSSRILPGFFNSPGELNQIKVHPDGMTDIIVSARNFEKRRALWIRTYNLQGELVRTSILQPDVDKHLLFGRSVKLADGRQLVAGVYGRFTEYSRGVFVASIQLNGDYVIQYYNFAELKNFFSYMKARQQKRVKGRIERKTIKGKKIKFNYRLLVHDLIDHGEQLLLVGEAFYPHYVYPRFYNPQARTERIFDGYQYTHAIVIGFGKDGELKWDNSFEINDVRTFQLQQFVRVQVEEKRILLMYLFNNLIRTKIIDKEQVLEGKAADPMDTGIPGEELDVDYEHNDKLDGWYGRYFFAYGTQTLKSRRGSNRKVFFVNKITYR